MTEISETFGDSLSFRDISIKLTESWKLPFFMKAWIIVTSFKQLLLIEVLFTQYMR
ncbi:hypothetical protein PROVRETT_07912 [Providencia rettgeri DSM 1131]|nr:hypothetical protein PROVRETT_07912 [Providencia rettgeri DSM 1131]